MKLTKIYTLNSILFPTNELLNTYTYEWHFFNSIDTVINYNTVKNLATMSYDAYYNVDDTRWTKVPYDHKNISVNENELKVYLFKNETTNIIAIKGTSINGKSVDYDRFNDNLFFSCCATFNKKLKQKKDTKAPITKISVSRVNETPCNIECYPESLNYTHNYINLMKDIVINMQKEIDFDKETVIFTGHSLGGAVASVMGLIYNKTVIAFNSPGMLHYIKLSGLLETFVGNENNIYNFGHNADSISHGHCNICKLWGYNLETECHIGHSCIYDAKNKLKMTDGLRSHQLKYIIDYILPEWETDFPECIYKKKCIERNCQ
jgi:lipase ATG15